MGQFFRSKQLPISYLRKGTNRYLFCVHNFTPNFVPQYFIALPNVDSIHEVFNTDREEYWGSGKINRNVEIICDPDGPAGELNSSLRRLPR